MSEILEPLCGTDWSTPDSGLIKLTWTKFFYNISGAHGTGVGRQMRLGEAGSMPLPKIDALIANPGRPLGPKTLWVIE